MDDEKLTNDIVDLLGTATKHGIYLAKTTKRGLTLRPFGAPFELHLQALEQIVQAISSVDVSTYITRLLQARLAHLDLDPAALLKLRATLALGLASARYADPQDRRLALARTYREYVPPGRTPPAGAERYRDAYSRLRRVERDQLLRDIAVSVSEHLTQVELSEPRGVNPTVEAEVTNGKDDYRIVSFTDRHVFPEPPSRRMIVYRTREIKALRNGVTQFRQQYSLFTSSGARPHPKIIGIGAMEVHGVRGEVQNELPGYRYDLIINFPPLAKDRTYLLTWMVESDAAPRDLGVGDGVYTIDLVPRAQIEHAEISARFAAGLQPTEVWRLDDVVAGDARLPDAATAALSLDNGYVEAAWQHPRPGRASGIAWRW